MFTSAHQQTDPREVTRVEVRSKWNLVIIAVFYSNVLFMCGGFLCALNMKQFISGKKKKGKKSCMKNSGEQLRLKPRSAQYHRDCTHAALKARAKKYQGGTTLTKRTSLEAAQT